MMRLVRTTLNLTPDAFHAAKSKAAHENISLGQAVSELILQGLREHSPRRGSSNTAIFRSAGGVYTSQQVEAGIDEE